MLNKQVYYELDEERKKVGAKDVAICRVEQLCPFPYDLIQRELKRYPSMRFKSSSFNVISYFCHCPRQPFVLALLCQCSFPFADFNWSVVPILKTGQLVHGKQLEC